jgi:phosphonate transport system permease protein
MMLRIHDISFRYPNGKVALADFELTVNAGELLVVLGGNGSGKTTLLRCVARILKPTAGEVWLDGTNLSALEGEPLRRARLELAMISQHASLIQRGSVLANVANGTLGRHAAMRTAFGGLPRSEIEAARRQLDDIGLADLAERRAGTLSAGQAQRVAIARALVQRPRVLLADEPVANLDPEASEDIMRLLQRLAHADNLAVLCVLHQIQLAHAYADRVIGIRDGRVAFNLSRDQISHEAVRQLYIGHAGAKSDVAPPGAKRRAEAGTWSDAITGALRCTLALLMLAIVIQAFVVVEARPQALIAGIHGIADLVRRAMPPDFSELPSTFWPMVQTVDIALFGTLFGIVFGGPLAMLAAANMTPSRSIYYAARAIIGLTRAVPDLVWALLFVTAVGLGPFPGGLALGVHSIGMLGRLFAETIEHMDMEPIRALQLAGARRIQVFARGIIPALLPSLLGISLYRLDENIRSSLVLGVVGAGGIGFQLLTAMNLFQYQQVSLLLIVIFAIVFAAERGSATLRQYLTRL